MIQKINDYQIINLNSAIERLPTRINETTIQGVKQRMVQHLEDTFIQKNRLEQIILEYKENHDYRGLTISQTATISNKNNTKENIFQTPLKVSVRCAVK